MPREYANGEGRFSKLGNREHHEGSRLHKMNRSKERKKRKADVCEKDRGGPDIMCPTTARRQANIHPGFESGGVQTGFSEPGAAKKHQTMDVRVYVRRRVSIF